jgi:hypothetical protein
MKIKLIFVLLSFILVLSSCAFKKGDLTILSTNDIDYHGEVTDNKVEGLHCRPVFFVPIRFPRLDFAVKDALENAGPEYDALIDVTVYELNQSFIIGRFCFKVEGIPINTKKRSAVTNENNKNLLRSDMNYLKK